MWNISTLSVSLSGLDDQSIGPIAAKAVTRESRRLHNLTAIWRIDELMCSAAFESLAQNCLSVACHSAVRRPPYPRTGARDTARTHSAMPKKSNNEKKKEALAAGKSAHCLPITRTHAVTAPHRTRSVGHAHRLDVPSDTRRPCAEPKMTKQQEKAGRGGNAKKEAMKAKRAAAKDKGTGW